MFNQRKYNIIASVRSSKLEKNKGFSYVEGGVLPIFKMF